MSIYVQLETEMGVVLVALPDKRGLLGWLLGLAPLKSTTCLQFIDPYGNTIFNPNQIAVLKRELESIVPLVRQKSLDQVKEKLVRGARSWPSKAQEENSVYVESVTVDELREYLAKLIGLVDEALSRGPHQYLRFIGD